MLNFFKGERSVHMQTSLKQKLHKPHTKKTLNTNIATSIFVTVSSTMLDQSINLFEINRCQQNPWNHNGKLNSIKQRKIYQTEAIGSDSK